MGSGDPDWSNSESLRGQLQRGRGQGYRSAMEDPSTAADLVLDCIHHDPRWDHQVEDRGWYYASLVIELGIEVASVLPPLDDEAENAGDDRCWVATDVLSLCARRGLPGAIAELRRYLRSGRDIDLALQHLLPFAADAEAAGFVDDLLDVADSKTIESALVWTRATFDDPVWRALRDDYPPIDVMVRSVLERRENPPASATTSHVHRVANLWNVFGRPRSELQVGDRGETTQELLDEADAQPRLVEGYARALQDRTSATDLDMIVGAARDGDEGSRAASLRALGLQGNDRLLDLGLPLLTDTDDPDRVQRAVLKGLRNLTSDRAVEWARTAALDPAAGYPARAVLAKSARRDDIPQVRSLLEWSIEHEAVYDQGELVDALARLDDTVAADLISVVFDSTTYSYLRAKCASALANLAAAFPDRRAVECLWDCEAAARTCGLEHARATPSVRARWSGMAGDVTEADGVRALAEQRLASPSP